MVGCRGVGQLGGLLPCPVYSREVLLRLRLVGLFYSLKVPFKAENKEHLFIFVVTLYFISLYSNACIDLPYDLDHWGKDACKDNFFYQA